MRKLALVLLVFTTPLWAQHSKKSITTSSPALPLSTAHYQLIAATVDNGSSVEKTVFLLDNQTGEVWKYQAAFTYTDTDGTKKTVGAVFIPIALWTQGKQ